MPDPTLILAEFDFAGLLETAFYPALLGVFIIASLGVPIPEDVPLIAAGVVLHTHPDIASWTGTILVSLVGIMSGDLILYTLGKRWGPHLFEHRWTRWIMTPARFRAMKERFHRYGVWMVFVGRFIVGVRAMMCMTAGVTRFPYWKFFLADFTGAVITVTLFIGLGYTFADMLPTLQSWLGPTQWIAGALVLVGIVAFIWWEIRRHRRHVDQRKARIAARRGGDRPARRPRATTLRPARRETLLTDTK